MITTLSVFHLLTVLPLVERAQQSCRSPCALRS